MTKQIVIGLSGLAGSGKSTVAKMLQHKHGFSRRPFAFPLKRMLGALGITEEVLDGPSAVKEMPVERFGGKSVREALQSLGTEWGRNCMGADFWVNQWRAGMPEGVSIVADDVRFPNEAEMIRSLGGFVIRIERTGAGSKVGAAHASENIDAISYDILLRNDKSEDDLLHELEAALKLFSTSRAA